MSVHVRIPTPLQPLTGNQPEVELRGATVQELVNNLSTTYPGVKERICDAQGKLRRFVNVYVNDEDIRFLQNETTPLKDGDRVSIVPAIAGGGDDEAVKRAFTLVFPQRLIKEPVMFVVARKYDLMLNIRRARITATVGEAAIELEGPAACIDAAVKEMETQGVKVEAIVGDIIH